MLARLGPIIGTRAGEDETDEGVDGVDGADDRVIEAEPVLAAAEDVCGAGALGLASDEWDGADGVPGPPDALGRITTVPLTEIGSPLCGPPIGFGP